MKKLSEQLVSRFATEPHNSEIKNTTKSKPLAVHHIMKIFD